MAILLRLAACGRSWLRHEDGGRVAGALRSPAPSGGWSSAPRTASWA
jgi:hypothetical protein